MGRGRYVEAATYEGSEKVLGVVVGPEDLEIHIVAATRCRGRYQRSPRT